MGKIDLTINKTGLQHNIEKAKENNVIIPTIAQMQHPETIPEKIQEKLKTVGLWDVNPLNLFRITWKNEAKETGGLYQAVPNYVEIPSELSGVPCRILAMAGKWFPTGCHKVGMITLFSLAFSMLCCRPVLLMVKSILPMVHFSSCCLSI